MVEGKLWCTWGELGRENWLGKMIVLAAMSNQSLFPLNIPQGFTQNKYKCGLVYAGGYRSVLTIHEQKTLEGLRCGFFFFS